MGDDKPHGQFTPLIGEFHRISVDKSDKTTFNGVVVAHERRRHLLAVGGGELVNPGEVGQEGHEPVGLQINGVHQDQLLVPDRVLVDDGGNKPAGAFRHPAVDGLCCIAGISSVDRLDGRSVMG